MCGGWIEASEGPHKDRQGRYQGAYRAASLIPRGAPKTSDGRNVHSDSSTQISIQPHRDSGDGITPRLSQHLPCR